MKTLQQGFTLIELMIVVAIIGILAAVAIPSYQDYTARAQVSEAVSLTSQFKTSLAEFFADNGNFASASLSNLGGTTAGKYVSGITFTAGNGSTIAVVAKFKSSGVAAAIQNDTFAVATTDGGKTWSCGKGGTAGTYSNIQSKFSPGACK